MTAAVMTEAECRRVVAARSGGTCECCLSRAATDMAHRLPRSHGGGWCPSNITHRCRRCHDWEGAHPAASYDLGWRLRSNADPTTEPFALGGCVEVLLTPDGRRLPVLVESVTT